MIEPLNMEEPIDKVKILERKLNEVIGVLNSMCDKWDYTPKPEGQTAEGNYWIGQEKTCNPEIESQEHMKKSMHDYPAEIIIKPEELKTCEHIETIHHGAEHYANIRKLCEHKWVSGAYLKEDGYAGTGEFCSICGVERG